MYNLLYKELRLAAHPNLFVFTLLGALVIVPAYPYGMVFLFRLSWAIHHFYLWAGDQ